VADPLSDVTINDFGLIADVYDELVDWAPYARWTDDLEKRLRGWGLERGDWILDAACGTGLSSLPWAERGYRVVGTDMSALMLRRAEERLRRAGQEAQFLQQDLLHLEPGRLFDAALCMHSGLDYILDPDDLCQAFRSLRGCLVEGGLFAFDKCLDVPSFYRDDCQDTRQLSCGYADFRYRWDRRRKLLEQHCTVTRTDRRPPVRSEVTFLLSATPPDRLLEMVESAGFQMLERPQEFTVGDPGAGIFRAV